MPRSFGFFFQILDLDSRIGGCMIRVINDLVFKSIWKTKERRFKTNWTLSLILRFNLLGGYSIWSVIFMAPRTENNF
jgi:hypothetical protein